MKIPALLRNFSKQSIQRRWKLNDLSPVLGLCTILDAWFKHLNFLDKNTKVIIAQILQSNTE